MYSLYTGFLTNTNSNLNNSNIYIYMRVCICTYTFIHLHWRWNPSRIFLKILLHIIYDEKNVLKIFFDSFLIKKNVYLLLYNKKFGNVWWWAGQNPSWNRLNPVIARNNIFFKSWSHNHNIVFKPICNSLKI